MPTSAGLLATSALATCELPLAPYGLEFLVVATLQTHANCKPCHRGPGTSAGFRASGRRSRDSPCFDQSWDGSSDCGGCHRRDRTGLLIETGSDNDTGFDAVGLCFRTAGEWIEGSENPAWSGRADRSSGGARLCPRRELLLV